MKDLNSIDPNEFNKRVRVEMLKRNLVPSYVEWIDGNDRVVGMTATEIQVREKIYFEMLEEAHPSQNLFKPMVDKLLEVMNANSDIEHSPRKRKSRRKGKAKISRNS